MDTEKWLTRLDNKLDQLLFKQQEMNIEVKINTAHMGEHMRRSDLLEKQQVADRERIRKVEYLFHNVKGFSILLGVLATIAGIVYKLWP